MHAFLFTANTCYILHQQEIGVIVARTLFVCQWLILELFVGLQQQRKGIAAIASMY